MRPFNRGGLHNGRVIASVSRFVVLRLKRVVVSSRQCLRLYRLFRLLRR